MQAHAAELSLSGRRIQGRDTQSKAASPYPLGWAGIYVELVTPEAGV